MSQSPQPASATAESTDNVSAGAIDASCRWPLLGLYYGAAFWLVLSAVAYLLASMSFHAPAMFADCAYSSYGRMAPLAGNLLIYGFCIPAGWAAVLWMLARTGRTRLANGVVVMIGGKLWNIGVFLGAVGILIGDATGFEGLEFPQYAAWPLLLGSVLVGISGLNTLRARHEREMHPVQWFAGLSVLWFPWIYLTAMTSLQIWPVRGMAQGVVHSWALAQLQVVLLGLMGVASLFYFMPVLRQQALPSRHLALFTLLGLIFCGGWTGVSVTAPVPAWVTVLGSIMSVCLMLPVLALILNLWSLRSIQSAPEGVYFRFGVRAFILWTAIVVVLNASGLARCLGFTLAWPAIDQLFLQGFSLMISVGAAYYILPRITGHALPFPRLVRGHFWLASVGIVLVVLPFLIGAFKQGADLADASIPFTEVALGTLMPIRVASMGQLLLILGHGLLLVNVLGLTVGLLRAGLKGFDNSPAGLAKATEGAS